MDDREQELLTLGAIESQLSRSESRVILGDLIEIISERYGAEEDSVRQAATRLKRLGRVGVDSGPVYQIVDMEAR
jgi:DNA-binding transcriptional regulator PaaX